MIQALNGAEPRAPALEANSAANPVITHGITTENENPAAVAATRGDYENVESGSADANNTSDRPLQQGKSIAVAGFRTTRNGLEYSAGKKWNWICGPLQASAETRDESNGSWGLLLQWNDDYSKPHDWVMPLKLLAGDAADVRRELLDKGLRISTSRAARDKLAEYLSRVRGPERARYVTRIGWHEGTFVLPDVQIGVGKKERLILASEAAQAAHFAICGDLKGWQDGVGTLCQQNSRLMFAVSVAFAAPLLHLSNTESAGFNLVGLSSIGKTTALCAAASVWGKPTLKDPGSYIKTWHSTINGLEGVAAAHSDTLLCLDELSLVDASAAGQAAYMLIAGQGKNRADRNGKNTASAKWRALVLSTGEIELADKITEDGRGRVNAGQEVRMIDVPADAGAGIGLFDCTHDSPTVTEFADKLKSVSVEHCGLPAREFLQHVARDRDGTHAAVHDLITRFMRQQCPAESNGQVARVASRFALVASAGEMATKFGIVPWVEGEAFAAAANCFDAWLAKRGGMGASEIQNGIRDLREFLEQHEARFEHWHADTDSSVVRDRAGFQREMEDGAKEFVLLPAAWREALGNGKQHSTDIARKLVAEKVLIPDSTDGKPQCRLKRPGQNLVKRYYRVSDRLFALADDA